MRFLDSFYFISGIQTLIITLIFFFYKSKKIKVNRYLGLFFLTLLIEITIHFIYQNTNLKSVYLNPLKFNFLTTVLLLFYVVKISDLKLKKRILYLIPAAIEFLFFSIIYIIVLIDDTIISDQSIKNIFTTITYFSVGFNIFISIKTIRIINLHRKFLPQFYTNTKNKSLNWITVFCSFCIFYNTGIFIKILLFPWNKQIILFLFIINILILYYISIASIIQINIINYVKIKGLPQNTKQTKSEDKELILAFEQVEKFMKVEQLYLNSNISLTMFSKKVNIPKSIISKSLKETGYDNFNSYVNAYRIEGVKKLLLNESYKKYSIVAISKEVGFNSRASFYKNFKERVGISPSDYINQN